MNLYSVRTVTECATLTPLLKGAQSRKKGRGCGVQKQMYVHKSVDMSVGVWDYRPAVVRQEKQTLHRSVELGALISSFSLGRTG